MAEEWEKFIGMEGPVNYGYYEVNKTSIGYFLEVAQHDNPLYYDEEYAKNSRYGGIIAPPTMIRAIGHPPTWVPGPVQPPTASTNIGGSIPLDTDGGLNAGIEMKFYEPLKIGDKIHFQSKIIDIKPRTTRLGKGFFVTEELTFWNQNDVRVAVLTNTLFRYKRGTA